MEFHYLFILNRGYTPIFMKGFLKTPPLSTFNICGYFNTLEIFSRYIGDIELVQSELKVKRLILTNGTKQFSFMFYKGDKSIVVLVVEHKNNLDMIEIGKRMERLNLKFEEIYGEIVNNERDLNTFLPFDKVCRGFFKNKGERIL